jgi:hypothetical protein
MNTTTLSPALLHTLAVGIDRLNDGDPGDRAVADRVVADMARAHGLVFERGGFVPVGEATSGYVLGAEGPEYAFITGNGSWSRPVAGHTLYLDEGCLIPLRAL